MWRKLGIIVLYLLLNVVIGNFQVNALEPEKPIHRYLLDEWGIEDGLPSDIILSIAQTPDGFLWIGTERGLVRYDGLGFEPFYFAGIEEENVLYISSLLADKTGGLWIGTASGLLHVDRDSHLRSYSTARQGMPVDFINCLAYDSFDNLWISTGRHYLFRFKDGKFTQFNNTHGLSEGMIYSIHEDRNGNLWIGNRDGGLFIGNNHGFSRHPIKIDLLKSALNGQYLWVNAATQRSRWDSSPYSVYEIYEDRQGMLWVGTNFGLLGIANAGTSEEETIAAFSPANGLSDNNIWSIVEDQDGNLWVGTENGLNRIKRDPAGKAVIDWHIGDAIVWHLFEDKEKSLWVGTCGSGLKQMRDGTFFTYWKQSGVPFWDLSLFQDRKGQIWVGSSVGDLYRFDNGIFRRELRTNNNIEYEIRAIEQGEEGELWLGTLRRGILRIKNKGVIWYTTEDGLTSNMIRAIFKDNRGRFWIGTERGGVNRCENGTFCSFTTRDGLTGDDVYIIHEDRSNNIWLGTSEGITVLANGEFNPQRRVTYLKGSFITEIYEEESGTFWIGTARSGLKRLRNGEWKSFTEADGLGNNYIAKILEDHRGNFWIGSRNGIFRISKNDLNAFARKERYYIPCTVFGLSDGLKNAVCRIGSNSAIKTQNGELWFGTRKGISVANPEKVIINKHPPPVVIKRIFFNYNPVSLDQVGKSFWGINEIKFVITIPTFVSPEKAKIRYKLENWDNNWHVRPYFYQRDIHYNKLPPGEYRFHVVACNSSDIWNNKGASFSFVLKPYFHQTLLFKLLVLFALVSIVVGLYFFVKKQLYLRKLKQKYRNSTLDPEKAERYLKKLIHFLEVEKLYRDEAITLISLAKRMSIAPRYLSQIVNEQLNKNFRELINGYRIEEAKELLTNPGKKERDFSIMAIAFEVGFNSKEVFNRTFKKYTGMTPTEYKRKASHKG
jgi:ligand-binding sensor domain-containing protein/AraC-like DNA-binding protein